jgi:tetratricopeptide (TPR) repeat protein
MNEEQEESFEKTGIRKIISRYENMRRNKEQYFFDVYEFENIIDYYMDLNESDDAFEAIKIATKQHPASTTLQLKKAQVLVNKGESLKSLEILKKLERIELNNHEVFIIKGSALCLLGDIKGAIENFNLALSLNPEHKDELIYTIALSFIQLNRHKDAIQYLLKANKIDPDNLSYLYELGFCYNKIKEFGKSIEFYKKYLELDPFADNIWYNLGIIYNKINKLEKAVEAYDYALAINQENVFAWFNKANVLVSLRRYKEAIEAYEIYLELEEEVAEALTYIGDCYEKLYDNEKAIEYYKKALKADPEFPEPWFCLGNILLKTGMPEESIYYLKKAVHLDREDPLYWFKLGRAYKNIHETRDAYHAFRQATKLDPYDEQVWLEYADLLYKNKLVMDAITILSNALTRLNSSSLIYYRLAAYHYLSGDYASGYINLNKGLSLNYNQYEEFFKFYPEGKSDKKIRETLIQYKNN